MFRAEKSYTNKHSTEFSGFDLEFSYITSFKDVMKMEEELLTAGLKASRKITATRSRSCSVRKSLCPPLRSRWSTVAEPVRRVVEEEFGYKVDESEKGDLTTEPSV